MVIIASHREPLQRSLLLQFVSSSSSSTPSQSPSTPSHSSLESFLRSPSHVAHWPLTHLCVPGRHSPTSVPPGHCLGAASSSHTQFVRIGSHREPHLPLLHIFLPIEQTPMPDAAQASVSPLMRGATSSAGGAKLTRPLTAPRANPAASAWRAPALRVERSREDPALVRALVSSSDGRTWARRLWAGYQVEVYLSWQAGLRPSTRAISEVRFGVHTSQWRLTR